MLIKSPLPPPSCKVLQLYHTGSLYLPQDPVIAVVLQANRESDSKVLNTIVLSLKDKAVTIRHGMLKTYIILSQ